MTRHVGLVAAWALAGAGAVLGPISLGPLLLLPAAAVAVLLSSRTRVGIEAAGALAGAGSICLLVAYLQREGPGWHCTSTPDSVECGESADPRPWLVIGVLLVGVCAAALVAAQNRRRHARRE